MTILLSHFFPSKRFSDSSFLSCHFPVLILAWLGCHTVPLAFSCISLNPSQASDSYIILADIDIFFFQLEMCFVTINSCENSHPQYKKTELYADICLYFSCGLFKVLTLSDSVKVYSHKVCIFNETTLLYKLLHTPLFCFIFIYYFFYFCIFSFICCIFLLLFYFI